MRWRFLAYSHSPWRSSRLRIRTVSPANMQILSIQTQVRKPIRHLILNSRSSPGTHRKEVHTLRFNKVLKWANIRRRLKMPPTSSMAWRG
jgi:hypothetical protein